MTLKTSARTTLLLLISTSALPGVALAQTTPAAQPTAAAGTVNTAPTTPTQAAVAPAQTVRSITVTGNQRLEPDTVRAYADLRVGQAYNAAVLDAALRRLAQTELFADFQITDNDGALTIQVTENPVINRIILEGNSRLKDDKITPELRLAPRQIYTRSRVRADVARIIELYKRQGRFAATVEPQLVRLDQNR